MQGVMQRIDTSGKSPRNDGDNKGDARSAETLTRRRLRRRRRAVATIVAAALATTAALLLAAASRGSRPFGSVVLQSVGLHRDAVARRSLKSMMNFLPARRDREAGAGGVASPPNVATSALLRRTAERVDNSDVPFFVDLPHDTFFMDIVRSVASECYELRGKAFDSTEEITPARYPGWVDMHYAPFHSPSSYAATGNAGKRFHFVVTPHFGEGIQLFNEKHRGRMFLAVRHPILVAEMAYYSLPGTVRGDVAGFVSHAKSTGYHDNWMTRMLADVDPRKEVTSEDYAVARTILEERVLMGDVDYPEETIMRRLKPYFGWTNGLDRPGCEWRYVNKAIDDLPNSYIERRGVEWRVVGEKHVWDMELYDLALKIFGAQKMEMPVHWTVEDERRRSAKRAFGLLRDVKDPRDETDVPFYWHIPKASGTTVKDTICDCFGVVRTEMVRPPASLERINYFLNVDLSTFKGIRHAIKNNIVELGIAGLFVSQHAVEGSTVFTSVRRGRAFTVLRHPVKLAVSLFYYRQIATWEPTYRPEWNDITLTDYINTPGYYDNWMVRMLTSAKFGRVNEQHLDLAKSVLKEKFVVGIAEHMDEVFRQLKLYYGWEENRDGCLELHLHTAPSNQNKYDPVKRGGEDWTLIAEMNKYDMSLYYYALEQFGDQSEKMFHA